MEEDDMFALMDNIGDAFTDFSQITTDSFAKMGPMIAYMDFDDFDMIPAATVSSVVETICNSAIFIYDI